MAIMIANVTDLQNMSLNLAGDYELANDIDASGTTGWNWNAGRGVFEGFIPVGDYWNPFTGTLDGKGFTITGLYSNREPVQAIDGAFTYYMPVALIGRINGGTIQNLTLANVDIRSIGWSGVNNAYACSLAGWIDPGTTIDNCDTSGSVQATANRYSYATGLFMWVESCTISDCNTSCTVSSQCTVSGNATACGFALSIFATPGPGPAPQVTDCSATGNVTSQSVGSSTYANGFADFIYRIANLERCHADGDVTVSGTGIFGNGFARSIYGVATVTDCYATGDVTSTGGSTVNAAGFAYTIYDAGTTLTRCYATGAVSGTATSGGIMVAGFVDDTHSTPTLYRCYATGTASATNANGWAEAAGFVCESYTNSAYTECYCTGNVSCESTNDYSDVAGFIAYQSSTVFTDCYALGDVDGTVTGDDIWGGGFCAYGSSGSWTNCYSAGAVTLAATGTIRIGGFTGYKGGAVVVTACFWDTEASGVATDPAATGKTTAEMKTRSTFYDEGWSIDESATDKAGGYPYLAWQSTWYIYVAPPAPPPAPPTPALSVITLPATEIR